MFKWFKYQRVRALTGQAKQMSRNEKCIMEDVHKCLCKFAPYNNPIIRVLNFTGFLNIVFQIAHSYAS